MDGSADLFLALFAVCQFYLHTSDLDTMKIVSRRMTNFSAEEPICEALLEIDEATVLLDKYDVDEIKTAQQKACDRIDDHDAFKRAYTSKMHSIRAAVAAKAKAGPKAKAKAKGGGPPPPHHVLPPHIAQADIKHFTPPNSSIWRDNKRGGWCGQVYTGTRMREDNMKCGGSEEALRALLKRQWTEYLNLEALTKGDCPYPELLR